MAKIAAPVGVISSLSTTDSFNSKSVSFKISRVAGAGTGNNPCAQSTKPWPDVYKRQVIGECEIDEAPMLYIGEKIGTMKPDADEVDIAVDPLDGTTSIANGMNNAISVLAAAQRGCLLHAPDVYLSLIHI